MATDATRPVLSALRQAADVSVRIRLVLAVLLAVTVAVLAAMTPVSLKFLIDSVTNDAHAGFLWGAAYIAALVIGRIAGAFQTYLFVSGEQRLQRRLESFTFGRLLHTPLATHLAESTGATLQAHTHALQGVRLLLTLACLTLLPIAVQLTVVLLVAVNVFPAPLWAVLIGAIAAYALVFTLGVRRVSQPTTAALASHVEAAKIFTDALIGIEAIKAFTAESDVISRHDRFLAKSERAWRDSFARRVETGLAAAIIFAIALGAALWLGVNGVSRGSMSVGDLVLLNAYLLQIVGPLESTGYAIRDLAQALTHLRGWRRLLGLPQEGKDDSVAKEWLGQASSPCTIEFRNVSFAYTPGRAALVDVSFEAPAGGVTAIVGVSGAGKSSILRLLQRQYAPDDGEIWIDGEPIGSFPVAQIRHRISVVSQDVVLFNDTLGYNLRLGQPNVDDAVLHHVVIRAGLGALVARLPLGLETHVGERGLQLSGGERQRVAIARALLRDFDILILDEATSALDAQTEQEICNDLLAVAHGTTTLIVTHRLAVARRAEKIIVLENGRVIEQGRHDDLLSRQGRYAFLWRQQISA